MAHYLKGRKCVAVGCDTCFSNERPHIKLFSFPGKNFRERYSKWKEVAQIEIEGDKMPRHYLCALHFAANQFCDKERNFLIRNAVPTVVVGTEDYHNNKLHFDAALHEGERNLPDPPSVASPVPVPISSPQSPSSTQRPSTPTTPSTSSQQPFSVSFQTPVYTSTPVCEASSAIQSLLPALPSTPAPSRKKSLLSAIGLTRRKLLTPRKNLLLRRAEAAEKQLRLLKKKLKAKQVELRHLMEVSSLPLRLLDKLSSELSFSSLKLIEGQFQCADVKGKGRRWSKDIKVICLSLYKRSPKLYHLLQGYLCLPSKRTLLRMLADIPFETGINIQILESLRKHLLGCKPEERICILMFDEMSIRQHLQYNSQLDRVTGYEDLGNHGRSRFIATKALVFMVKSLRGKWKQPVAYYFPHSTIKGEVLVVILKEVISKCRDVGMKIVGVVCDMGATNVRALKVLGSTPTAPFFMLDDEQVFTFYDPPHLLKSIRNMLFRNVINVSMEIGDTRSHFLTSWKHILTVYEKDKKHYYRNLHKLTDVHVNPTGPSAMRVKTAAHVLSHTVAATLNAYVSCGALDASALGTAHVCAQMNKVFDSVNGTSPEPNGADGLRSQVRVRREQHHLKFWRSAVEEISSWSFINKNGSVFHPPSQKGWITTLNAMILLWEELKREKFFYFSPRSVNQDSLENLFGCIRAACGSNPNPTVSQFVSSLKSCVINEISLRGIRHGNCESEPEPSSFLNNLHEFLGIQKTHLQAEPGMVNLPSTSTGDVHSCGTSVQLEDVPQCLSLAYVSGFIAKRCGESTACNQCKLALVASDPTELLDTGLALEFREHSECNKGLTYPSVELVSTVGDCTLVLEQFLSTASHEDGLKAKITTAIKCNVNWNWLANSCSDHFLHMQTNICDGICSVALPWWCKKVNRDFSEDRKHSQARKMRIVSGK